MKLINSKKGQNINMKFIAKSLPSILGLGGVLMFFLDKNAEGVLLVILAVLVYAIPFVAKRI